MSINCARQSFNCQHGKRNEAALSKLAYFFSRPTQQFSHRSGSEVEVACKGDGVAASPVLLGTLPCVGCGLPLARRCLFMRYLSFRGPPSFSIVGAMLRSFVICDLSPGRGFFFFLSFPFFFFPSLLVLSCGLPSSEVFGCLLASELHSRKQIS